MPPGSVSMGSGISFFSFYIINWANHAWEQGFHQSIAVGSGSHHSQETANYKSRPISAAQRLHLLLLFQRY